MVSVSAAEQVQVGLDRVEAEKGLPLRGKRVGLVVHAASVTARGRHAIDVLKAQGVDLRRLFTPEHGLRSRAAAGEKVASGVDPASGLAVVSLYGQKTKPEPKDLEGLDTLVFDLQDAGVRFYTYISTMMLCLEAAAEAGIEMAVLDRPNPLGGERVEGPTADLAGLTRSLVNMAPGPLVHGLTAGEMARFVASRMPMPARLSVVSMQGWKRSMTWADTGRTWVPPSPNLRTAEAAIAYPGVCLLEGTNVTEGRGTESPFLLLGAPWLDPQPVIADVAVPGFSLEATRFTPRPSEAAPSPKHSGEECGGIRVRVTDPNAARPFALGVALLRALRRAPRFEWRGGGSAFDRLVGTRKLREALERGDGMEAIVAMDAAFVSAFREQRRPSLLY